MAKRFVGTPGDVGVSVVQAIVEGHDGLLVVLVGLHLKHEICMANLVVRNWRLRRAFLNLP